MTQNEINEILKKAIQANSSTINHEHDRINYCISEIKELKESKATKKALDSNMLVIIIQALLIAFMLTLVLKVVFN